MYITSGTMNDYWLGSGSSAGMSHSPGVALQLMNSRGFLTPGCGV